jgi:tight adherence protein B
LTAVVITGCLTGAALAGLGGGCAGALAALVAWRRRTARRGSRRRLAASADLADVLGLMVGELRSGAHPAAAAAAVDRAEPEVLAALGVVTATARLGGDVPAALTSHAATSGALGAELRRLAAAWAVSDRHGVPLADLLDAVHSDLDGRVRFHRRVSAQLAGPQATAAVLAALPVLGVLLGEAMGAAPWRVLSTTLFGEFLLVVGVGLICAGLVWNDRISARAVR